MQLYCFIKSANTLTFLCCLLHKFQKEWVLKLKPGKKHIRELQDLVKDSIRIGFKLETNVDETTLINRAKQQIQTYGVEAVVANIFEEMHDSKSLRARIVHSDGTVEKITTDSSLAKSICNLITDY